VPIAAIQTRRLYRQAADQLRRLIQSGEYPAGARLPAERDLASQLRISRPTLREALIVLEVEGLVDIRVGSGIYVTNVASTAPRLVHAEGVEGPLELLRAREFIESAIAAEAAVQATASDIRKLDLVLQSMPSLTKDRDAMVAADRAFHTTIAAMLGNAVLERCVGELFDQRINPYFQRLSAYFEDDSTWRSAASEHRAIRDAIAAADPQRAKAAMAKHLAASQERFSANFEEVVSKEEART
jgi:DNA-binding FadR family transcriptional regulator